MSLYTFVCVSACPATLTPSTITTIVDYSCCSWSILPLMHDWSNTFVPLVVIAIDSDYGATRKPVSLAVCQFHGS